MKQKVRNALAISGIALVMGTSGFIIDASANSADQKGTRFERSTKGNFLHKKEKNAVVTQRSRHLTRGTVTSISDSSFVITRGQKTFTVNVSDASRLLNNNWAVITFGDIKVGDKVRVLGSLSDTTITAKTVRDISI